MGVFDIVWSVLSIPSALNSIYTGLSADPSMAGSTRRTKRECITRPKYRVVGVPNYFQGELQDSIDLQVKSLLYCYRRLRLNELGPFLKPIAKEPGLDLDYISSPSYTAKVQSQQFVHNSRLDQIYNLERFKEELLNDPYRVLIDYPKNKFRAMLILSDEPTEARELPDINADQEFMFSILGPDDSIEHYIDVLVFQSGIYAEHRISDELKIHILQRVITRQIQIAGGDDFNNDDRVHIILSYVQKLGLHVQVERIYRATLKAKEREAKENMLKFAQDKSIQSYKTMKKQRSRQALSANSNSANKQLQVDQSPSKKSFTGLTDAENSYLTGSDSESPLSSSSSSGIGYTKLFTPEEKSMFYEQSKMAVRIRIERERLYLV